MNLTSEADTGHANSAEIQYVAAVLLHSALEIVGRAAGDLRFGYDPDFEPLNS